MKSLVVSLLLVFGASTVWAASAAAGTFNVLSMNVAGLPEIFNSNGESGDKTTNTMIIGQDLATYNYDVIHVQEVSTGQPLCRCRFCVTRAYECYYCNRTSITMRLCTLMTTIPIVQRHLGERGLGVVSIRSQTFLGSISPVSKCVNL